MHGVALFIFGLGLFFTGLTQLGVSLKQIASHRFRVLVRRYAHPRWKALLFGLASGTLMQSSSAALMILASLAATGLIAVREAFPILAAFNVGDTVLIFIATFDVRGAALVMTGVTAILLYF
ncbi:MAG TPA: Na/Pi symporter, partial [Opitutales bacterium]|nr:Na/Pi symporter [Opitutales bacterium]